MDLIEALRELNRVREEQRRAGKAKQVSRDKRLVGVPSTGDVATTRDNGHAGQAFKQGSRPGGATNPH